LLLLKMQARYAFDDGDEIRAADDAEHLSLLGNGKPLDAMGQERLGDVLRHGVGADAD
jgi:hypothetical protein